MELSVSELRLVQGRFVVEQQNQATPDKSFDLIDT
jgi:hypothetical protein